MKKVILNLDWYTKFILTVIALLLLVMSIKPVILNYATHVNEAQAGKLTEERNLGYHKMGAEIEGSDHRAEADAEEWYYLAYDPELLKTVLDRNHYYQEHRFGRKYLECLLQEIRNTERERSDPVFVIDKKGERYFVYKYVRTWQH